MEREGLRRMMRRDREEEIESVRQDKNNNINDSRYDKDL